LEDGELEKLVNGEVLSGEMADYPSLGDVFLSLDKTILAPAYYFNLIWNKKEPSKYHFKIFPEGLKKLQENKRVYGR